MAHKKGLGSSRNGRDSQAKRLGVKPTESETTKSLKADAKKATERLKKEKGAAFPNYLLDEDTAVWQNTWKLKGPPAVRVYGKDGKLTRQFDYDDPNNQFEFKDVEQLVQKLLQK